MRKSQIIVEGAIAFIRMSGGHVAKIDACDLAVASAFGWAAMVKPRTVYAYRTERVGEKKRTIYLHRVIMGVPQGLQVDHVDGDGLNNCRSNLRLATESQNQCNRRLQQNNASGFKGVYWDAKRGKWRSEIRKLGKKLHLGRFDTPQEAHHAYSAASAELHGEFGRVA